MHAGRVVAAPVALFGFCLFLASTPHARISAVNALSIIEASRAEGFGGAAAAVGRDASVSWLNPAASAEIDAASLTLAGQRGYFNDAAGQALLSAPFARGALSLGFIYFDAGSITLDSSDGSSETMRIQQDFLGSIGYARPLTGWLSGGMALKAIRSQIFNEVAGALAFDAGLQARLGRAVKAGACVQNLGGSLTYRDDSVALPAVLRIGLAAGGWLERWGFPSISEIDRLLFIVDAEFPFAERIPSIRGGVEYQLGEILALRAGARPGNREELAAFSAGIGLSVGQYRLDYSIRFGREFSNPQTLSLTIGFFSPNR